MSNGDKQDGFWGWAKEHWFLSFLLAGAAISAPAAIISAARQPIGPTDEEKRAAGLKEQQDRLAALSKGL